MRNRSYSRMDKSPQSKLSENPYMNDYAPTLNVNRSFQIPSTSKDFTAEERKHSTPIKFNEFDVSSSVKIDRNPSSRSAIDMQNRRYDR